MPNTVAMYVRKDAIKIEAYKLFALEHRLTFRIFSPRCTLSYARYSVSARCHSTKEEIDKFQEFFPAYIRLSRSQNCERSSLCTVYLRPDRRLDPREDRTRDRGVRDVGQKRRKDDDSASDREGDREEREREIGGRRRRPREGGCRRISRCAPTGARRTSSDRTRWSD